MRGKVSNSIEVQGIWDLFEIFDRSVETDRWCRACGGGGKLIEVNRGFVDFYLKCETCRIQVCASKNLNINLE